MLIYLGVDFCPSGWNTHNGEFTWHPTNFPEIWENVVGKKLCIAGGIGASGAGEAFGRDYELPNMSAYAEGRALRQPLRRQHG